MASKRKKHTSGIEKLKRRWQADGLAVRVVPTPAAEEKISALILDLVAPFVPYATTPDAFKVLVGMGVAAWNLPLLTGPERQSFFTQVVQLILTSGDKERQAEAEAIFNTLVKRKQLYFANDKRFIVSYHITEDRDGFHVAVATTLATRRQESDK